MKKLLLSLLFFPCLGWGAYQPITGSTITVVPVAGQSLAVNDAGGSLTVDGTVSVFGSTVTVVQQTGTNLKVDASGVAVPVTDNSGSLTVDGTVTANQGTPGTTDWPVRLSTTVVNQGTAGTTGWRIDLSTGVQARESLLVSSNTAVPTAIADALQVQAMGDKYGRTVTLPIAPWGLVQTATATLTTSTVETVFISTGAANVFNRLIGCIGENTSTTAADITFRQTGPTANNTGSFKLGMSVSNVPVGFFPPGGIPQRLYGNWTIQGSASVTSLHITCWYVAE